MKERKKNKTKDKIYKLISNVREEKYQNVVQFYICL